MLASIATSVLLVLCIVVLRHVSISPLRAPVAENAAAFVVMDLADQAQGQVHEQAMLLDSAPLFLPTTWNTSHFVIHRHDAGQSAMFDPYPQSVSLDARTILPEEAPYPARSLFERAGSETLVYSLGDTASREPAVARRAAVMQVSAVNGGSELLSVDIPHLSLVTSEQLWQPAQFWVLIDEGVIVGPPVLATSSGSGELDESLRACIMEEESLRYLPSGYYRIDVGP
jgi:hypothetical protein